MFHILMQKIADPIHFRLIGKVLVGIGKIVDDIIQMRVFEVVRCGGEARRHHQQMPNRHGRHIRAGRRGQLIRKERSDAVIQAEHPFLKGKEHRDGRKAFGDRKQAMPLALLIGREIALVNHLALAQKHQRMQPILRLLQLPAQLQQPPRIYAGLPGRTPLKILSHAQNLLTSSSIA